MESAQPDLSALSLKFLESRRVRGFSEQGTRNNVVALRRFSRWCEERGVQQAAEVTRTMVESYQRWLFYYRKKNGKPLSATYQHAHLTLIRKFFSWLTKQNLVAHNPASELELPRLGLRLPQDVLTEREVETLLSQPDIRTPLGLRDRAILETFYSTGMRRMEVSRLGIHDVNFERETVMVRQGKGHKDRVIPIGARALLWLTKYVQEVRPALVVEPDCGRMFLGHRGGEFAERYLTNMVTQYVQTSGIAKKGSCHMLRHTMATLMLEGGADVRFIQAMLGHTDLSTTEIYTHVSIVKLKDVHTATHPGASVTRKLRQESPAAEASREKLLAALAHEAAEEYDEMSE